MGGQLGAALGGGAGGALGNLLGLPAGAAGAARPPAGTPAAAAGGNLGIRLWEIVPVDSNAFSAFLSGSMEAIQAAKAAGEVPSPRPPPAGGREVSHDFGGFDGSYHGAIVDENSRINVQSLDNTGTALLAVYTQIRAMIADPKYDFIFDEPDANRDRVRREDTILAMKDWIDIDETASALDPTNPQRPFVNGFSDENSAYSRYEPRYKAKNGRFDSLEELYMVRGVNDRFMAAFGDRLTVWPDINSKLNVNTDDPQQMLTNILIAAANPNDPLLRDPRLLQTVLRDIQVRKMFSFFGMSAQDFVSILQGNGIRLRPEIDPRQGGNATNLFGSTSDTFRITATGQVGRIEKKITAVVRYDDAMGRMLYWKED